MKMYKVLVVLLVVICCVWGLFKYWPSADQVRAFVIDLYIKIFCEK